LNDLNVQKDKNAYESSSSPDPKGLKLDYIELYPKRICYNPIMSEDRH